MVIGGPLALRMEFSFKAGTPEVHLAAVVRVRTKQEAGKKRVSW